MLYVNHIMDYAWVTLACELSFWEIFIPADLKPLGEKAIVQFTMDKEVFAEFPTDFIRSLCYACFPGTFGYQGPMSVAFIALVISASLL